MRLSWLFGGMALLRAAAFGGEHCAALGWPVDNPSLTATFGESRSGRFLDGIDIAGGAQPVKPIEGGEIIFVSEDSADPRGLPSGLGSFVVLGHRDGLRSLYAHLERGSIVRGKTSLATGDALGSVGDSGDTVGDHLGLCVIDGATGEFLNPLTILPRLGTTATPVINAVSIERDKKLTALSSASSVAPGMVGLVVDASEQSPFVDFADPMAPYTITASLDGDPVLSLRYGSLGLRGGTEVLDPPSGRPYDATYLGAGGVRLGTLQLKPGESELDVTASDVDGNQATARFILTVGASP